MKRLPPILDGYTDILQTQLITEKDKPRSWFATRGSNQYVIKGPISEKERDECLRSQTFKELLGIPHTNMRAEGEYLIQTCIGDYTTLQTEVRSSRWEKKVRVPIVGLTAWSESYLASHIPPSIHISLLEGLLFRKIMGTNDTCNQNFVVHKDLVYCIDDRSMNMHLPYMWKGPVKNPKYSELLDTFWPALQTTMSRWKWLLQNSAKELDVQFALEVLHRMQNKDCWKFHK